MSFPRGRSVQIEAGAIFSASDLARIGAALYRGVQYKGRSAWQSWLADGLGVDSATIRRWLMDEAASRRSIPRPLALLLMAAYRVADRLQMWDQPRGTLIVERMAEIALGGQSSVGSSRKLR